MSAPQFWSTPFRYMRWASHEKPAIFYSLIVGAMGPVALVTLPPIRRYFGSYDPEPVRFTYPIPEGPRKIPEGFDDE
ncbi:NADH:ubiquinone oxidoreductase subunit NDUFA3 [Aspergillus homomorphus CBS 101889]|uniref:NADH-ubiquinone oxidoreductase 9.5 kDa subunit n=1 Tax=Aspergillus homomorphus (strain CBS 101889) TaxID=1450537 RepID=A0A395HY43_ASPHC|nr:NADH-ubiquinone oxidoreductase 9.5 kDa subunit [Aspergillus homomorphus CBS 101889]RAL12700.1 NADH-ubiquinone oxidoreductase 9.5 kDa subunit [Aspergillus homomorphus CBS 101889]